MDTCKELGLALQEIKYKRDGYQAWGGETGGGAAGPTPKLLPTPSFCALPEKPSCALYGKRQVPMNESGSPGKREVHSIGILKSINEELGAGKGN